MEEIADCAVVGVADDRAGEAPKAFVVKRPGSDIDEGAVLVRLKEQLAPYKVSREVAFVEEIPKSPAGKILRRLLRQ